MNRFEDHVTHATVRELGPMRNPIVVRETTALNVVVQQMIAGRTGCVLIVGADMTIKGIFTERDLLRRVVGVSRSFATPVGEVMTASPDTITPTDSLYSAIRLMHDGCHRHLPVVENGRPVGVISARSLIRHLSELYPAAIYNQPPNAAQKYDEAEGA